MTTASDIITRSAKTLGYLGRTEVLSAGDANDGLTCLNAMLDSWSNESLLSFFTLERSFTETIGQTSYTIGSGGYINSTRPSNIIRAFIRDVNQLDYPLRVVPMDIWNDIGQKTITSQIANTLFYDPQYPLGVINIFPVPLLAYTIFFDSTNDQLDLTSLTTSLSLPVGYERAYVLNLAVDMMNAGFPCMLDQASLAALGKNAADSKAAIKRVNSKEVISEYDSAIVSRSQASYNIYSDSPARG
jgi:hypothetical protein